MQTRFTRVNLLLELNCEHLQCCLLAIAYMPWMLSSDNVRKIFYSKMKYSCFEFKAPVAKAANYTLEIQQYFEILLFCAAIQYNTADIGY